MKYSIIVFAYFILSSFNISEFPLEIEVTDFRNSKGQVILKFYKDDESFKKDRPFLEKKFSKSKVSDGSLSIKIDLPEGRYGIAIIDDEDSDGEEV